MPTIPLDPRLDGDVAADLEPSGTVRERCSPRVGGGDSDRVWLAILDIGDRLRNLCDDDARTCPLPIRRPIPSTLAVASTRRGNDSLAGSE